MSTLSVIMANYNHAHFVGGALRAILSQSRQPNEVIVVDDGSTDDSVEVISGFERTHANVRLYRNDANRGVVFTANRALSLASGDYVYAAAADDRIGPRFVERSMAMLEAHPQAALCCSDPASFDHTGVVSRNANGWSDRACYFTPQDFASVLRGGFIAGHTTIARRTLMLELEGFRPELKWACDWFLWLVLGFRHGICYVPEPLAAFRRRLDSFSAVGERDREQQDEVLTQLLGLMRCQEYRDVLPLFVRSGAFHHFGPQLVDLVLGDTAHWNLETLLLLLYPLHDWNLRMASDRHRRQENLKARLEQLIPSIVEQCARDRVSRVAFFGAGSHTQALLPMWQRANGPPVVAVLATDPGRQSEVAGLPVVRAADYHPAAGEGIVLSSNSFETEMAETCRRLWPDRPHYTLYHVKNGDESTREPIWEPHGQS